jgi:hypothetical protein
MLTMFEDFGEGVCVWVCWEVDVVVFDGFSVEVVAVLAIGDNVEVADGLAGGTFKSIYTRGTAVQHENGELTLR